MEQSARPSVHPAAEAHISRIVPSLQPPVAGPAGARPSRHVQTVRRLMDEYQVHLTFRAYVIVSMVPAVSKHFSHLLIFLYVPFYLAINLLYATKHVN